ncbi:MAG TPA: hypothetical protein IAC62_08595 [Candidatus Pelethocola excrementipullorum]|nr:hypothetical protein [Candidatus Pelethocola excrementipullorum]
MKMGLFDIFKKKNEDSVEEYYKQRKKREEEADHLTNNYNSEYFEMMIDDVFRITGRGVVVVGKIGKGTISAGDIVIAEDNDYKRYKVKINKIEIFRKITNVASAGDNVGLLLSEIEGYEPQKGDYLRKE